MAFNPFEADLSELGLLDNLISSVCASELSEPCLHSLAQQAKQAYVSAVSRSADVSCSAIAPFCCHVVLMLATVSMMLTLILTLIQVILVGWLKQ